MKYHIEKNTVQETLIIPLFGRLICSVHFPELFSDPEAKRICESLDYDFSDKRKKMESAVGLFSALEVAQRQYDLRCEVEDYLKAHPKAAVVNMGCGLDDTFRVTNWEAAGGHKSADEIRTPGTLEVVEFSDFQVDSVTGDLFGEIRLAYLYDENGRRPVSGGSVSGSMKQLVSHMTLSKEMRQYDNVRIPSVTRLDGVTVTGK